MTVALLVIAGNHSPTLIVPPEVEMWANYRNGNGLPSSVYKMDVDTYAIITAIDHEIDANIEDMKV